MSTATETAPETTPATPKFKPIELPPVAPNVRRLESEILTVIRENGPMREEVVQRMLIERKKYSTIEKDDYSEAMVELICAKHITWVDPAGWKATT